MKVFKQAIGWISLTLFIFWALYMASYRFWHPSLTETQLFFKMWWMPLLSILFFVGIKWGLK